MYQCKKKTYYEMLVKSLVVSFLSPFIQSLIRLTNGMNELIFILKYKHASKQARWQDTDEGAASVFRFIRCVAVNLRREYVS